MPLKDAAGSPFGKADRGYLYLHVQKLCKRKNLRYRSASVVAVCCEGRHFLILYTHAHMMSRSQTRPSTMPIGLGTTLVHKGN